MERIEFQIIEEVQQKDEGDADTKILEQQIAEAEQHLRYLQNQEFHLQEQYEKIQQKLEDESRNNEILMEHFLFSFVI